MAMAGTSTRASSSVSNTNGDVLEVFKSSTTSILSDDSLTVPTEGAKLCLEISDKFKDIFEDPSEEGISFAKQLVFQLKQILEKWNNLNKEKMWIDFHKLRSSKSFEDKWKAKESVKLPNEPLFYQHFTQEVFEKLNEFQHQ